MKTLILASLLALTAVSGAVVTSQPAAARLAAKAFAAAKLTNETARPQVFDLGPRFISASTKSPARIAPAGLHSLRCCRNNFVRVAIRTEPAPRHG